MKLEDLYEALESLVRPHPFALNDNRDATNILEYNQEKNVWEYYFLDERRGKSDFKTFLTEEKACKYVLNDAIRSIKLFTYTWLDAVERDTD